MRLERFSAYHEKAVTELFISSVHTLGASCYTPAQLDAWAPAGIDPTEWSGPLFDAYTLLALDCDELLGFGSIFPASGYLDRLFVSPAASGHGVGKALVLALEAKAEGDIWTYSSDNALGFFIHMGYKAVKEELCTRFDVQLHRTMMKKER